ncbi:MAG: M28 family peptidase [Candidatus Izemoplasmatales bacterium]
MKFITKHLFVLLVVGLSVLTSLFVLYTPIPSSDTTGFSAVSAAGYIKEFSLLPHSVFDEENHETVRLYLKDTLESLVGTENVSELNYTANEVGSDYDIKNLLAVIPGESENGILLVAHYDSRGHIGRSGELGGSYGAADDGYGLATLLEITRIYAQRTDLKTSIYILMTDGEETGLYGAGMVAKEQSLMDKIGFVVNLEARGIKGPAYMFETSTNNEIVIDFYKNAQLPVTYSIATAVYTVMPNSTDFTEFLAVDKEGVNFAVLDSLYYYHTPRDNYTNIDLSSIQHYGSQVVPLVEEFTSSTDYANTHYFEGTQNQIFFTLLPNVFVSYTEGFANVIHIIVFVVLIALLVLSSISKTIKPIKVLKNLGYIFLSIVVLGVIGVYASKLIAFLGKTTWSLTYVRMENSELPTLVLMIGAVIGLGWLYKKLVFKKNETKEFLFAASILLSLLALLTGFALSGASFLFLLPAFFGLVTLILLLFYDNVLAKKIWFVLTTAILTLIFVPLVYTLFLAITVGGLAALFVIALFYLIVEIPSLFTVCK